MNKLNYFKFILLVNSLIIYPLFSQLGNDDASGAVLMTSNPNVFCSDYLASNSNTTPSAQKGCNTNNLNDSWYKFTATNTQHSIYTQVSNTEAVSAELYSDTSKAPLKCLTFRQLKDSLNKLNIGSTYYIKLYPSSGTNQMFYFKFCFSKPVKSPINTSCDKAKDLSAFNTYSGSDTISNGTATSSTCAGNMYTLWYSFIPKTSKYYFSYPSTYRIQFYKDCNSAPYACEKESMSGYGYRRVKFEAGKKYYFTLSTAATEKINTSYIYYYPDSMYPNDTCTGAIELTNGINYTYQNYPYADYSAQTLDACTQADYVDTWYMFKANAGYNSVYVGLSTGSRITSYGFAVYESCQSTSPILCTDKSEHVFDNLTPGKYYYVKANNSRYNNSSIPYQIGVKSWINVPSNDNCAGATALPLVGGTSNEISSNLDFASLTPNLPSCGPTQVSDVWYKFTAEKATHHISSKSKNVELQVYASCTANSPLLCSPKALGTLNNLVVGQQYFIRLVKTNALKSNFKLQIHSQVPDACTNASLLDIQTNSILPTYSVLNNLVPRPYTCGNGLHEKWFKFTPKSTQNLLMFRSAKTFTITFAKNCDSASYANPVACLGVTNGSYLVSNLTPGTEYLICASSSSPIAATDSNYINFDLGIYDYSNEDCETATEIFYEQTFYSYFNTTKASTKGCPLGYPNNLDVWCKFTATDEQTKIKAWTNTQGIDFELFQNSCTGPNLNCAQNLITTQERMFKLKVGEIYFIRFIKAGTIAINLNVTLSKYSNTNGDLCETALEIPIKDSTGLQTVNLAGFGSSTKTCVTLNGATDRWYKFKPRSSKTKFFYSDGNSSSYNSNCFFELYDGCNLANNIFCVKPDNYYSLSSRVLTLDTSKYYYFRVSGNNLSNPPKFAFINLIENDDCQNAKTLAPNDTARFDFINSTPSALSNTLDDVWYKFTPTYSWIELGGTTSYQIYDNCAATNLAKYTVVSNSGTPQYIQDLTPNKTYYLRISRAAAGIYASQKVKLWFKNIAPPSHDLCANPLKLVVSDTGFVMQNGILIGATPTVANTSSSPSADVWYYFESPYPYISFDVPNVYGISFAVYKDCINSLYPSVSVNNVFPVNKGQRYYVRASLYAQMANSSIDKFSFGIKGFQTPANDSCNAATTVVPSNVPVYQNFNLRNATVSPQTSCDQGQDVWYKFTANTNSTTIRFSKSISGVYYALADNCTNYIFCRRTDTLLTFKSEIGKIYYLSIYGYNLGHLFGRDIVGKFAVVENPNMSNTSCASATEALTNTNNLCTNTYQLDFLKFPRESSNYLEAWYMFKPSASNQVINVTGTTGMYYDLYEDCSLTKKVSPKVGLSSSSTGSINKIKYADLNTGKYYYLRISHTLGAYSVTATSFCINSPTLVNDECSAAISLTDSCFKIKNIDLFNATKSANPSCTGTFQVDAWFKFSTANESPAPNYEFEISPYFEPSTYFGTNNYILELTESCSDAKPRCIKTVEAKNILPSYSAYNRALVYYLDSLKPNTSYMARLIVVAQADGSSLYTSNINYRLIKVKPNYSYYSGQDLPIGQFYNTPSDQTNCYYYDACLTSTIGKSYNTNYNTMNGVHDMWIPIIPKTSNINFVMDNNLYFELHDMYPSSSIVVSPKNVLNNFSSYYNLADSIVSVTLKLDSTRHYQLRIASKNVFQPYWRWKGHAVCVNYYKNDELKNSCSTALPLASNVLTNTKLLSTTGSQKTCLGKDVNKEIWFKFNAGKGEKYITIDGGDNKLHTELYDSCRAVPVCMEGITGKYMKQLPINPNKDYYLRVFSNLSSLNTSFSILLSDGIVTDLDAETEARNAHVLYPNPVKDRLYINQLVTDAQDVSIWDCNGKKVGTYQLIDRSINVSHLDQGMYLLELGNSFHKFMIVK